MLTEVTASGSGHLRSCGNNKGKSVWAKENPSNISRLNYFIYLLDLPSHDKFIMSTYLILVLVPPNVCECISNRNHPCPRPTLVFSGWTGMSVQCSLITDLVPSFDQTIGIGPCSLCRSDDWVWPQRLSLSPLTPVSRWASF